MFNAACMDVLSEAQTRLPNTNEFRRIDLWRIAEEKGYSGSNVAQLFNEKFRAGRGVYKYELGVLKGETPNVTEVPAPAKAKPVKQAVEKVMTNKQRSIDDGDVYVPNVESTYVPWGNYRDVLTIIKSGQFYPTFITGLSGNGKTMMVEQACAKAKREYVRVQITPETDEDDLLGGFRLIDGETVFSYGPVVKAMKHGAILLIDEIDRGSNKLMCLQSVLEGKSLLLKKTGEVVKAADGFNVIATANTKGRGSDDGRYSAATILDDAFLERFIDTMEQEYPKAAVEKKIVINHMEKFNKIDEDFADNLITWAEIIRKTFADGGVDEVITTRRLCHIVQIHSVFGNKMKAINRGIARFDEDTKAAFADLYTKVDAKVILPDAEVHQKEAEVDEDIPF